MDPVPDLRLLGGVGWGRNESHSPAGCLGPLGLRTGSGGERNTPWSRQSQPRSPGCEWGGGASFWRAQAGQEESRGQWTGRSRRSSPQGPRNKPNEPSSEATSKVFPEPPNPHRVCMLSTPYRDEQKLLMNMQLLTHAQDTGPGRLQPWGQVGFGFLTLGVLGKRGEPTGEAERGERTCAH